MVSEKKRKRKKISSLEKQQSVQNAPPRSLMCLFVRYNSDMAFRLQESGDQGTEAKDTSGGKGDTASSRVGVAGGGSRAGTSAGRLRRAASGAGARLGGVVVAVVRRRVGGSGGGASLSAGAGDNGGVTTVDDDGSGAADRHQERGERAGDVHEKVGLAGGKTGRDGGNLGLRGHAGRESRLCCGGLGHASDDTEGVGLCEVGGETVGVRDGGGHGGAIAGDADDLWDGC